MAVQKPCGLADRLSFGNQPHGQRPLIRCQLERTAEPHTPRFGRVPAVARALMDQLALELGHTREHCQHHAPRRRGRVRPRFGQRAKSRSDLVQLLGNVEQVAGRACV